MSGDVDRELGALLEAGARERPRAGARRAVVAGAARRLAWRAWTPWLLLGGLGLGMLAAVPMWTGQPARSPAGEPSAAPVVVDPSPPSIDPVAEPRAAEPAPPRAEPRPAPETRRRVARPPRRAAPRPWPAAGEPAQAPRTEIGEQGPSSTLQQEVALLSRAHRALERGAPRDALDALAEHRERFPRGVLASDREAATRVARCIVDPDARAAGLAYAASHPRSPLATRLRTVCAAEGDGP